MDFVKYGIVGCGEAWLFHRSGYNKDSKMKFVSVYDVDEKRAKNAARRFKMNTFPTYEEFLKSDIDAVLVMVPHYLHERLVVAAAEAGKHVLCEKPMATTLEGCDEMIKATKKNHVKFMIAENHRFLPAHRYIAEAVHNGLIGNVFLIRSYEGVNEISGLMKPGFWKGHPIMAGGGSLADMGAHKLATMSWILNDEVEAAYSWLTKQCTNLAEKAEDNAMAFFKFKKGTIAETVLSFTVQTPATNSLEVCGTLGTILEDHSWKNPVKIYSSHRDMGQHKGEWYEPEIEHGPFPKYYEISFRIEDNYFTDCILEDKDPEFTPEQARGAIAAVLMAYLSARLGRTATEKELMDVYKKKGTKSILESLEKFVQNNY
jgi:predicted dehydrogenase